MDNSEKGSKVSPALETVTTTAEKVQRQPVIAHLIRATWIIAGKNSHTITPQTINATAALRYISVKLKPIAKA